MFKIYLFEQVFTNAEERHEEGASLPILEISDSYSALLAIETAHAEES